MTVRPPWKLILGLLPLSAFVLVLQGCFILLLGQSILVSSLFSLLIALPLVYVAGVHITKPIRWLKQRIDQLASVSHRKKTWQSSEEMIRLSYGR